jgi:hypothetical protein
VQLRALTLAGKDVRGMQQIVAINQELHAGIVA